MIKRFLKYFPKIKANPNFTVIGHITKKNSGRNLVLRNNSIIKLKSRGWGSTEY